MKLQMSCGGLITLLLLAGVRAQTGTPSAGTVKTSVRNVVVDVVVTDDKGHPVDGLAATDFVVTENGKRQKIEAFSKHSALPNKSTITAVPPGDAVFTSNSSPIPEGAPLNVIFWDPQLEWRATFSQSDPGYVARVLVARFRLMEFLRSKRPYEQYAIFMSYGGEIKLLQGFTSDKQQLLRAMERRETWAIPPDRSGNHQLNFRLAGDAEGLMRRREYLVQEAWRGGLRGDLSELEARWRQGAALSGLYALASELAVLPGRKNVVCITPAMEWLLPDEELKRLATTLTAAELSLYLIDIRGLTTPAIYDVAALDDIQGKLNTFGGNNVLQKLLQATNELSAQESMNRAARSAFMRTMAEQTGGRSYGDTDIVHAARDAVDRGAMYYRLVYAPTNRNFRGERRRIKVDLFRPGLRASYRRGYIAAPVPEIDSATAREKIDPFRYAGQHGIPFARGITLSLGVYVSDKPVMLTDEQRADLGKFTAAKAADASQLHVGTLKIQIAGSAMPIAPIDTAQLRYEMAAIAFDEDGSSVNGTSWTVDDTVSVARVDEFRRGGYPITRTLLLPASTAWVRVVVRDLETGRLGSVEAPVISPK